MSVKFTDNSELVKEQIKKGVIAGLLAATGEVRSQTIRNSKRITSKTANSFQIAVDEDKLEGMKAACKSFDKNDSSKNIFLLINELIENNKLLSDE